MTLFAAPTRPVPAGTAVVSGEARLAGTGEPAAWAVVDVGHDGGTATGLCDEAGRFVVLLPYPEALPPLSGSPPHGSGLDDVAWPLTVSVRCEPGALDHPADAVPAPVVPPVQASALAQRAARLVVDGVPRDALDAVLGYGVPVRLALLVEPR